MLSSVQKGNNDGGELQTHDCRGAERRFPYRIKLGNPIGGFRERLTEIHVWLNQNCGAAGWAMTQAGLRGIVNDAVAIYFLDAMLAAAFVWR